MAAPALGLGQQLVTGQPARADDALVQWLVRVVAQRSCGEADALVGHAVAGGGVEVDAGDGGEFDLPAGFLQGFAQGSLE
ncbi:hypothetical protein D3C76_1682290 [compost metagenome]